MAYLSPSLTLIVGAVKKAAVAMGRDFNELEHLQTSVHNDGKFALRSYEKIKKTLHEELLKFKPNYAFVAETSDALPASGNYFAVNAVDGLTNFGHGNTRFAMSVAMVENNVVLCAVIYNPITDEMFFAEKGAGAFKEGFRSHERLRVAGNKNIERALFGVGAEVNLVQKALSVSASLNVSGCVALDLAYLAAGKLDVAVAQNAPLTSLAAGMLLVKEAGGYIVAIGETDVRTENLEKVLLEGNIIATNEALRQKAADLFA